MSCIHLNAWEYIMIVDDINDKKVIWLAQYNKYILVEHPTEKFLEFVYNKKSNIEIKNYAEKLSFTENQTKDLIKLIRQLLSEFEKEKAGKDARMQIKSRCPHSFRLKRYYEVNGKVFYFEYDDEKSEYIIHPKLAHLEVHDADNFHGHFQIFKSETRFNLFVNREFINSWHLHEDNYLAGKVSMQMLQLMHQKEENDWMATFHAAGISNGRQGVMFLGDSGNGKSTLSAILMANGYTVLADDFLPFDTKTNNMWYFPAALSIKKGGFEVVSKHFPEIKQADEYFYPEMGKTVRYLSNISFQSEPPANVHCKALVFVKYRKNSGIQFEPLEKDEAFQKLIPDSWISPHRENAKQFLDWFSRLSCYRLTYSDNHAMLNTVKQLFNE